jgi:hypothetical protein
MIIELAPEFRPLFIVNGSIFYFAVIAAARGPEIERAGDEGAGDERRPEIETARKCQAARMSG